MAETVYLLCALTSVTCTLLLVRSYRRTRVRLLLWSSVCFVALALNNLFLVVDLLVVPTVDLQFCRSGIALAGMLALVYGLVWESK